ncbi:DUF937 domain-containing protein [Acidaminobacter hydrogenoformans]|uniref:DUF937 domain-containing protein n=1 Tax=Acidaminobacter hydrogenoformans DSM 2784 TaxID=1120920 RepID=A0A1G5S1B1_9FIRM|nr:DUF937 domain-containing protein [Acidaminobacter hydrogenoformans]SCZ80103.1 protein of unknown function [Acidaminobacter hydrogenoformans DSM 2784]
MNLMELLAGQLNNPDALNKLGQSVGANPEQVNQLAKIGLPTLMKALGQNASTPEGASALAKALEQHEEDDVDDLDGFLGKVDTNDGEKILEHILSGKKQVVQQNLASQTGLQSSQVSGLLTQLAPLLLGALGQQKKQQNLDASGVSNLLNGAMSRGDSGLMGMASKILDADKDGDIMDDIGNLIGSFMKKR